MTWAVVMRLPSLRGAPPLVAEECGATSASGQWARACWPALPSVAEGLPELPAAANQRARVLVRLPVNPGFSAAAPGTCWPHSLTLPYSHSTYTHTVTPHTHHHWPRTDANTTLRSGESTASAPSTTSTRGIASTSSTATRAGMRSTGSACAWCARAPTTRSSCATC